MSKINKVDASNGRFYEIDKDVYFPSATTILSARPLEYGLKEFFLGHTKEEAEKLLNDAGLQGSKIHHTIELILKGETILPSGITEGQLLKTDLVCDEDYGNMGLQRYLLKPYTQKEDKMMKGFLQWWADFTPQTIASEMIIYSKKFKYAGTVDWIGTITIKGKPVLAVLDWKTGKGLYKDYDLQISCYLHAYNEMTKGKKKDNNPQRAFLLHLGVNKCGYKLQEVKDVKADFKRFKTTIEVWKDLHPDAKPYHEYNFLPEYKI